jgi:hypothetical protein
MSTRTFVKSAYFSVFVLVLKGRVHCLHLEFSAPLQSTFKGTFDLHDHILGAVEPQLDLAQRLTGERQFGVVHEALALVSARRRLPRRGVAQTLDDRLQKINIFDQKMYSTLTQEPPPLHDRK